MRERPRSPLPLGRSPAAFRKVFERRGWNLDEVCLSFIGYEGGKAHVARQKKIVNDIVGKHGGIGIGKGPGVLYGQKKCDTG
jgi:alkyldihydroxyacetonephosphate synthase